MTKGTDMGDPDLDDLFAQARKAVPVEDAALLARVYADALRLQPQPAQPMPAAKPGVWAQLVAALGGRRGLAGLGTAAVVGVMLGFVQPGSVLALTEPFFAAATVDEVDLMPGFDAMMTEG